MLKKISEEDIQRYAHQIILKNIGIDGQKKLLMNMSKIFQMRTYYYQHGTRKIPKTSVVM